MLYNMLSICSPMLAPSQTWQSSLTRRTYLSAVILMKAEDVFSGNRREILA